MPERILPLCQESEVVPGINADVCERSFLFDVQHAV